MSAGLAAAVLLAGVVAGLASGHEMVSGSPADYLARGQFRHLAEARLGELKLTRPEDGRAVARALMVLLHRSLWPGVEPHCRQMGEPAGPNRYFCLVPTRGIEVDWWVTYRVDPGRGRAVVHRVDGPWGRARMLVPKVRVIHPGAG